MIAVAFVALGLVGYIQIVRPWCNLRSARFHELASFHRFGWTLERARKQRSCMVFITPELGTYHKAMAAKYARAERYPWLPVAPDPPEPE
jgi:hypothetical protein